MYNHNNSSNLKNPGHNSYPTLPQGTSVFSKNYQNDKGETGFREYKEYGEPVDLVPKIKYPDLYQKGPEKHEKEKRVNYPVRFIIILENS